jgi:hypothetical protein
MTAATSLLCFILNLLKDPQAQAEFRASPEQVLAANGLTGVSAADIRETLPLVTDNRFVTLNTTNHVVSPSVVPPAGDHSVHAAIHYLHTITRTYRYDDHGHHAHVPGHGNIWAIGDDTHHLDDSHGTTGDPGASQWMGHTHQDFGHHGFGDANPGQQAFSGFGDHGHDPGYGDPAGSSPQEDFHHSGHDWHSFGSGATTTSASGNSGSGGYSGSSHTGDSHSHAGFYHANFGGGTGQTDPGGAQGHDAPAGSGDSGYGHDSYDGHHSYYGDPTEHGTHDPPEPHFYLDLH